MKSEYYNAPANSYPRLSYYLYFTRRASHTTARLGRRHAGWDVALLICLKWCYLFLWQRWHAAGISENSTHARRKKVNLIAARFRVWLRAIIELLVLLW